MSNFTEKNERLIAALLSEPTHEQAAVKAGISVATLGRAMQRPDFKAAFKEARRRAFDGAIAVLEHATRQAVDTLTSELQGEKAGDRIRAATVILDNAFQAKKLDVEEELAALHATLERLEADLRAAFPKKKPPY